MTAEKPKFLLPAITLGLGAMVVLFTLFSFIRNRVYRTGLSFWEDSAEKTEWQDMRSVVSYAAHLTMQGDPESLRKAGEILKMARELDYERSRFSLDAVKVLIMNHMPLVGREERREMVQFVLEKIDPLDRKLLEINAISYLLEGDLENARSASSLLNRINPHPRAKAVMGKVYNAHGCFSEAARELEAAILGESKVSEWHELLLENALSYAAPDDIRRLYSEHQERLSPQARRRFEIFWSETGTSDPLEATIQARLHVFQWDYARAAELLKANIARSADLPLNILLQTYEVLMNTEAYDEAATVLDHLDRIDPNPLRKDIRRAKFHEAREEWETGAHFYGLAAAAIQDKNTAYRFKRRQQTLSERGPDAGTH